MRLPDLRSILAIGLGLVGCGGGGEPPSATSQQSVVATLELAPATATLPRLATVQLTALPKDAGGKPLNGRVISWSSSDEAIASVSGTGLVTAVAAGTATISATSEGKSASAAISVTGDVLIPPTGGTAEGAGGAVTLRFPAGAVTAPIAVSITAASGPAPPPGSHPVPGSVYLFGPTGSHFGAPVTVTIKYNPDALPRWVVPGDLVLQHWDGAAWSRLDHLVVDPAARTVSGQTSGFSTVGVYFLNPTVSLTPSPGTVSYTDRSVDLTAAVAGEGRNPDALRFEWTTTGSNGGLDDPKANPVQYTAVTPILPAGDLDGVQVKVRGQFEPGGPYELLGEARTTVHYLAKATVRMDPDRSVVPYSGTVAISAVVLDESGQLFRDPASLRYEWTSTTNAGAWTPGTPARTSNGTATYTAFPAAQQLPVFPKGDKTTVKVILQTVTKYYDLLKGWITTVSEKEIGTETAFVEVIPKFEVRLTPSTSNLQPGDPVTLHAELVPDWHGVLDAVSYRWRNTGAYGSLSVTPGVLTEQNSVTYTANSGASTRGTDAIKVEAYVGVLGSGLIGTAEASVSTVGDPNRWRLTTFQGVVPARAVSDPAGRLFQQLLLNPLKGLLQYDPGTGQIILKMDPAVAGGPAPVLLGLTAPSTCDKANASSMTGPEGSGSLSGQAVETCVRAESAGGGALNISTPVLRISATKQLDALVGTIAIDITPYEGHPETRIVGTKVVTVLVVDRILPTETSTFTFTATRGG